MKTVFVINPVSGKGKKSKRLVSELRQRAAEGEDLQIYFTKGSLDAKKFVRKYMMAWPKEQLRIYVCGGDGTVNEAVNGYMQAKEALERAGQIPEAALGVIPIGSGNDFIRNLTDQQTAMDLSAQLAAEPTACDAIEIRGRIDGKETVRYCDNMINIGFDCNTVDSTNQLRVYPFISGSFAYLMGILVTLIQKKGANLKITAKGEMLHRGPLLLSSQANGAFCGGGVNSNPTANVLDGLMNINIIKDIDRLTFLRLLPLYMQGTHMQFPHVDQIIRTAVCEEAEIEPLDGQMRICIDGEIVSAEKIHLKTIKGAFNFLVPRELFGATSEKP